MNDVTVIKLARGNHWGSIACPIPFSSNKPMNDLFQEIADAPGEIFDIPEMRDLYEESKFDVEEYINGDIDY